MSVQEIIAEIDKLTQEERREVVASLDVPKKLAGTRLADLTKAEGIKAERITDVLARSAGTCDGLPEDMAVNHDHYLYGTPKQRP